MLEDVITWLEYLKLCLGKDLLLPLICKQEWKLVGKWAVHSTGDVIMQFYECQGCKHRCRKANPPKNLKFIWLYLKTLSLYYYWESFKYTLEELTQFINNPEQETIKPCTK